MAYNNREYKPTHITTSTTTQVFSGKGILHSIVVNSTTGTAINVYDAVSAGTGTVAVLKSSVVEGVYEYDASIANGLYITSGAAGDYTVMWEK